MTKNDFLKITDTSGNIKKELIENIVLNKPQADILFERIQQNQNLFSYDECFTRVSSSKSMNNGSHNFLTDDASYFINVKFLTLALMCLIFDITISKGFASFLFEMIGIDCSVIKLDNIEKCVAYKIKTEKRISVDQLIPLIQCNFIGQNAKCRHYKNDSTCGIWTKKEVEEAICSLESKKILKKIGDMYEIIF